MNFADSFIFLKSKFIKEILQRYFHKQKLTIPCFHFSLFYIKKKIGGITFMMMLFRNIIIKNIVVFNIIFRLIFFVFIVGVLYSVLPSMLNV